MMAEHNILNVDVQNADRIMTIVWEDGHRRSFHSIWLRDNCRCSYCRHPNGQKLASINELPADIRVISVVCENDGLHLQFSPDNHSAQFDSAWLRNFSESNTLPQKTLWDVEWFSMAEISRDYAHIRTGGAALAEWLELVVRYGVAVLHDVPAEKEMVCNIVEWFGYVRETNYGRLFEVKSIADPNNLAYTNMPLSVHTDNPYRDPPPGLQLFHCLQNTIGGGDSIVVDGFMAAKILAEENGRHYDKLARHAVPFRFCDSVADLRSRLPVLDIAPDGVMRAVNFNSRAIQAFDIPFDEQPEYYAAYRHFFEILQRPKLNLRFKMEVGDLSIVDNRRILHGRVGFESGGGRHLQGCYADSDALLSTWRMLRSVGKQ